MHWKELENLLQESNYPGEKVEKLVNGFKNGFDVRYRGPQKVKKESKNLKLYVGDEAVLWGKVMKEVKLKRFAGPFEHCPYKNYIQSPIGLVSKEGGDGSRLIFHLSYPRNGDSVNSCTPREMCMVKYPSLDKAIRRCIEELKLLETLAKVIGEELSDTFA